MVVSLSCFQGIQIREYLCCLSHPTIQKIVRSNPNFFDSGHWYKKEFIERLSEKYAKKTLTPNESIALAGSNCYSTIRKVFLEAGYDDILLSIGDHEIGKPRSCKYYSW